MPCWIDLGAVLRGANADWSITLHLAPVPAGGRQLTLEEIADTVPVASFPTRLVGDLEVSASTHPLDRDVDADLVWVVLRRDNEPILYTSLRGPLFAEDAVRVTLGPPRDQRAVSAGDKTGDHADR